jgi:TrmH family RNA methyltransferase
VRQAEHAFVAEGAKIVELALQSGCHVESVFVASEGRDVPAVQRLALEAQEAGARVFELGPDVMTRVADTVTPQPVCAVVAAVDVPLEELLQPVGRPGADRLWVVCVDVRDPGNLGAALRVASASGVAGVVVCAGSVDPYNPKTVRASAGSILQVPLARAPEAAAALAALRAKGCRLLGTAASGGTDYLEADLSGDVALVFGNEASGLPTDLSAVLDGSITIPMAAGTESLNVAMSAAVLCFEAARRRRSAGAP